MEKLPNVDIDDYDIKCQNRCGICFSWKRFFIPISLILPTLIYFDKLQKDVYIFFSLFLSTWIICWNIPMISKIGYTRPAYFEDLDINNKKLRKRKILSNIEQSKSFQHFFITIQQFILSFTIALIMEYGIRKYRFSELSFTEILTVIGALISLYSKITSMAGKIILVILYKIKKKNEDTGIQINNINVRNKLKKIIVNNKLKSSLSYNSLKKLEEKYINITENN